MSAMASSVPGSVSKMIFFGAADTDMTAIATSAQVKRIRLSRFRCIRLRN
jgi:hypothetical protein